MSEEVVNQLFEELRLVVLLKAVDPLSVFREFDRDGSSFIEPAELQRVLRRLDIGDGSEATTRAVVDYLDTDGQGRISYFEFCKCFVRVANRDAIFDRAHWAFPVLDQVRRHLREWQTTLPNVFSLTVHSIRRGDSLFLEKNQFLRAITFMRIVLDATTRGQLLTMLDRAGNGKVDFLYFGRLVGMNEIVDPRAGGGGAGMYGTMKRRNVKRDYYRELARDFVRRKVFIAQLQEAIQREDARA